MNSLALDILTNYASFIAGLAFGWILCKVWHR